MRQLSLSEQLLFCTTRIEAKDQNDNKHIGTGFFYSFPTKEGKGSFVYVVTNRHLVENMKEIRAGFSLADNEGNPIYSKPYSFIYGTQEGIIYHPDNSVDLCIFPVSVFLAVAHLDNKKLFFRTIDESLIPDADKLASVSPIEDIMLIGYPTGLWDESNNMPIVRKGITATSIHRDYNGKHEFLIDAACFPGSSGSPVFVLNNGSYLDPRNNGIVIGSRLLFVGILYKGAQYTISGEIRRNDNSNAVANAMAYSNSFSNIGYVIKSDMMNDFIPYVHDYFKKFGL